MRASKLLLPWGASTVIEHVIRQWLASLVDHVVLVTRTECADAVKASPCSDGRVHVLTPSPAPDQMKASVLCGLEYAQENLAPKPNDVWLLSPADVATIQQSMIDEIIKAFAADPEKYDMAIPRYRDKRGHPVLFSWRLAIEVTRLSAKESLRELTGKKFPRLELRLPMAAPRDLDTWEDYLMLKPVGTPFVPRPQ